MTLVQVLRWLLLIGFAVQIIGIIYGVLVLARIKREQKALAEIMTTFSDRSAAIAEALYKLEYKEGTMTPADIIRPFLVEADHRKPHLRIDNRFASCFELLEDTLALAGPDWNFIGKAEGMDGAGVRPVWFTPQMVSCLRPDGQTQPVNIVSLSMDAAWHLPTMRQAKVIVNSTANELPEGDSRRGPARLDSYDIPPHDYRWHNPPMPQRTGAVVTPMLPTPLPTPPQGASALPGRDEMMAAGEWLDAYYSSREGLQRLQGLSKNGRPDWEGVGAWLFDVYLKARLIGKNVEQARAEVVSQIRRAGPEWQSKHPGETP